MFGVLIFLHLSFRRLCLLFYTSEMAFVEVCVCACVCVSACVCPCNLGSQTLRDITVQDKDEKSARLCVCVSVHVV